MKKYKYTRQEIAEFISKKLFFGFNENIAVDMILSTVEPKKDQGECRNGGGEGGVIVNPISWSGTSDENPFPPPKKECKHDWVTSYTTPIGTGYECSKCGVEKGMEEKCNCHYQCGCNKGECNCYSLKPTPKKPIHSLPEKIDIPLVIEVDHNVEMGLKPHEWVYVLQKINSIIDWLQAEKEK